ncbi:MAG TPA: Na+/H+ antiporter subunit E [Steroidobacteraceae bacterium]|jgi:multicomponent K+:H+ antiporter subunit E|nr:Na+/H+ antiporter subunit E [Steroidobacteraceae bacterium]
MKRLRPFLILAMVVLWLLLNGTVSIGQVVLGLVVSIVIVVVFRDFLPDEPRMRRPATAVALFFRVLYDIVQSNLGVARVILGRRTRNVRSAFVRIPLELRNPHGLAVLAGIVTSTPGTIWAGLAPDGVLTLHVLDVDDEQALIRAIKERYERPLLEIFK